MNDISDVSVLLREAKPLYFKRKHRRVAMRRIAVCAAVLGVIWGGVPNPTGSDKLAGFYAELYMSPYEIGTETATGWLPTDEFGLIVVG